MASPSTLPCRATRRSRHQWQALINDCQSRGLDPEVYCQQHDLNINRFRLWQRRLARTDLDSLFMEVQPADSDSGSWQIELTIGDLVLKLRQ